MGSDAMGLGLGVGLGLDWEEHWDAVALNVPAPSPPATFRSHAHKCFISHFYAFFPVRVFPSYGSFFPFAFSGLKVEWQTNLEMRTLAICFVGR